MPLHTPSVRLVPIAVAVLGAALLLAGCTFGEAVRTSVAADATVTEAVTAVRLTGVRSGSVEVTTGTGPGVAVRRTLHYRGAAAPEVGQRVTGGVLTFTSGCSRDCSVDYRLEVPASAAVTIEGSSGRVTVTGVAAADVESVSGDVRADAITGPLKVRTSSGDITAGGLAGPSAEVRSVTGDARLDFARAPGSVSAESTSGNVALTVPAGPYRVAVSTTSGDRDVTVPDDPSATAGLAARTTSGDVRVRHTP
ncbi:DUF4097 family beta strand repeat-containing protein [Streptomyces sp. NPDC002044]|uniref:DUF4097 family beta strand repeat-containing protein n=1 Tax=Streptomyces sp. NPDC002044 TaxID=3154662 RepID=UPI00331DA2E5